MNIKKIPVEMIDVGERLRTINPVYVAEIAASFDEKGGEVRGQIAPIEVREPGADGRYRLVAGAHRLAAAQSLGWKTISASIFKGTNDEARMREIDENLVRHDLSALDRSQFMAERETLWKLVNPDSVQGRAGAMARWHGSESISFARDAAEKLGVSEKTIENWVNLHKVLGWLTGELRERVAASDLANNQTELKNLAAIEKEETRKQVIDLLLSGAEDAPRKVKRALERINGETPDVGADADKKFRLFTNLWSRCNSKIKRRIAAFIETDLKSAAS